MVKKRLLTTVAALAGRRIDAVDADAIRFPLSRAPAIRSALTEALSRRKVGKLVCSAACGADLLALAAAHELGIRRRIILPFAPDLFRSSSVIDRPGDWGPIYDRMIAEARATGDLLIINGRPENEDAYSQATHAIIREAASDDHFHLAIVIWEGRTRGAGDATEEFRCLAASAKFEELTILTC